MKKISDEKAKRILGHLKKASQILKEECEKCGDELCMDENIADECIDCVNEILIGINNTLL